MAVVFRDKNNIPKTFMNLPVVDGDKDDLRFLELGTAQGGASVWLLENILTGNNSKIYTVDVNVKARAKSNDCSLMTEFIKAVKDKSFSNDKFENEVDISKIDNLVAEYNVLENLDPYIKSNRCTFFNSNTYDFFTSFHRFRENHDLDFQGFDFVYIDASHNDEDVILDAILSFRLLKKNGVIIFDDYLCAGRDHHIGIDSFIGTHEEYLKILFKDYQVFIQKTKHL